MGLFKLGNKVCVCVRKSGDGTAKGLGSEARRAFEQLREYLGERAR